MTPSIGKLPLPALLGLLSVALLLSQFGLDTYIVGACGVLLSLIIYFLYRRFARPQRTSSC
jgi:hypothetical protein